MYIAVFTSPDEIYQESDKLKRLLDIGVDMIHLRKPEWTSTRIMQLIDEFSLEYRLRIKLHSDFDLVESHQLAGVHLNHRNPSAPSVAKSISKSCHSLAELKDISEYDYVTLSPIFDSISKQGYKSQFNLEEISTLIRGKRVLALGGVTPTEFNILEERGFFGAALLGYVWHGNFEKSLNELKNYIKWRDKRG